MNIKAIFHLLRPQQWFKSGFIFLALFFGGQLGNLDKLYECIIAFIAFSLAASSIYCFNDIIDADIDKIHPKKCKRPIASGLITKREAYVIQTICLIISLSTLFLFIGETKYAIIGLVLFYYILNIAYCVLLKSYAIVDVLIIAIGFVLRVLVGGIVTDIYLSEWIIIMTFLLALFLAFAKRRDDVIIYQNTGILPRKNTYRYNLEFMNQVMTIISTIIILAYIMYTISPEVKERFNSEYIYLTSVFVLSGIIRYLQITIVDSKSGSPTYVLLHDRFIQICISFWVLSFFTIIYCL
jgi:4-hydroxybenzoate polyprenyltransferase